MSGLAPENMILECARSASSADRYRPPEGIGIFVRR